MLKEQKYLQNQEEQQQNPLQNGPKKQWMTMTMFGFYKEKKKAGYFKT